MILIRMTTMMVAAVKGTRRKTKLFIMSKDAISILRVPALTTTSVAPFVI